LSSREPGWIGLLVNGIVLAGLLFAGLLLIELFVEIPSRTMATRIATAIVLGFVALRIRTLVRLALSGQAYSGFDAATEAVPLPAPDRTRFNQLHDEVRFGAKSQRYFDLVFWPRLLALAKEPAAASLPKPPGRSFGRGPSVETLARLVAAIEARR
jgi:hypothetical protein